MNESPIMDMNPLIGSMINKNIYNKLNVLLIPADTVLRPNHITLLTAQKIYLNQGDVSSVKSARLMSEAVKETKKAFDRIKLKKTIPLDHIKTKIMPLVTQFNQNPDLLGVLRTMETKDEYTYKHSFAVAVMATLIGDWMDLDKSDLEDLTISAFLHDIGKLQIPEAVLKKSNPLTKEEFAEIKKHPEYGYKMILDTKGMSTRQALVALQHHEREDGSGYPSGIKGSEIAAASKIVAVADVFHAMISKRSYKDGIPLFNVLRELSAGLYGLYDPKVTHCLLSKIMTALIGHKVLLSNGEVAKVIMINIHDHLHPLVKKKQQFIDLSKEKGLEIIEVL